MKINSVKKSEIFEDVKIILFDCFEDNRGFFTEPFRQSQMKEFVGNWQVVQMNESFSIDNVLRGLHFQWNPYMGKLVRVISGRMIDLILDIRRDSDTVGKIIAYEMSGMDYEWIWVPPGFAHGNFFPEVTRIQYLCSGEYNPDCEAGISPFAEDIDWSDCDFKLEKNVTISEKDKNGLSLKEWFDDKRSFNFI